jgi:hypothetical protein
MKGDKESDRENWYVTDGVANGWYGGTGKITTHVIAPSHLTIAKSIYNRPRLCAIFVAKREFYMMKILIGPF